MDIKRSVVASRTGCTRNLIPPSTFLVLFLPAQLLHHPTNEFHPRPERRGGDAVEFCVCASEHRGLGIGSSLVLVVAVAADVA